MKRSLGTLRAVPTRTVLSALALLALVLAPARAGSPEGRWRLVEQHYETGTANLAVQERPVRLELTHEGGRIAGKIWAGENAAAALPWPAFVADDGPRPVEVIERAEDARAGSVSVRYRVRPSPSDDLVLEVVESYALTEDGSGLEGAMRVTFTGGTSNRGGFVLRRRFVRE